MPTRSTLVFTAPFAPITLVAFVALLSFALLSFARPAAAQVDTPAPPAITAPVVDLADVVSPSDEAAIERKLVALRDRTGVQMAALVVSTLGGTPIDDFAQEVFVRWGGGSKERNDGLLLVLAVKDRRSRLHLGYGLEPVLSDATSAELLIDMRDDLRAERYGDAIAGLVDAVSERLDHLTPRSLIAPAPPSLPQLPATFFIMLLLGWLAALVSELLGPSAPGRKGKRLLPEVRAKYRNLALLAVGPGLVAVVFTVLGGIGFGLAYAFAWYVAAGIGVLSHEVFAKGPIRRVIFGVVLAGLAALLLAHFPDEPLPDWGMAAVAALSFGVLMLFLCGMFLTDGKGSGSSYSRSGSSSGYRSSSSSSSSSYRSSSSSSSRSWSGGGGSSGGGGASSGW